MGRSYLSVIFSRTLKNGRGSLNKIEILFNVWCQILGMRLRVVMRDAGFSIRDDRDSILDT